MQIQVDLFGLPARRVLADGHAASLQMTFEPGATVQSVLKTLKLSSDLATTVLIRGRCARPETQVQEGDHLYVFSPMAGG
jgi:hypothetical protein